MSDVEDTRRLEDTRRTVTTDSGIEVEPCYGPQDASHQPGVFPFTRGIYPDMYRGRVWTMRQ